MDSEYEFRVWDYQHSEWGPWHQCDCEKGKAFVHMAWEGDALPGDDEQGSYLVVIRKRGV